MSIKVKIAIIGGGPAGISAAMHASRKGVSHIVLEKRSHLFGAVYEFPTSKPVMAVPEDFPVTSDLPFEAGSREAVLDVWKRAVETSGINVRLGSDVTGIYGCEGNFTITLADEQSIHSEYVVIAIGIRGSLSRLGIPGAAGHPAIQYKVEDPAKICGEDIVVVGAGDSAIEDALALSVNNQVSMVYRGNDFPRANPRNARRVAEAIGSGAIRAYPEARLERISGQQLLFSQGA